MTVAAQDYYTDHCMTDTHGCEWTFRVFCEDWADVLVRVCPRDPSRTPVVWTHQVSYSAAYLSQLPPDAVATELETARLFENTYSEVTPFSHKDVVTGTTVMGIRVRFNRDNTMRLSKGDARRLWKRIQKDFPKP